MRPNTSQATKIVNLDKSQLSHQRHFVYLSRSLLVDLLDAHAMFHRRTATYCLSSAIFLAAMYGQRALEATCCVEARSQVH
jgi:hypothetical protein